MMNASQDVQTGKVANNEETADPAKANALLHCLQQNSLATKGDFLAVVAHKWRQPLNSIALIIHNMVDAWKHGEMSDELIERSEKRAMEQIDLLSRSIDDFRSSIDPDRERVRE